MASVLPVLWRLVLAMLVVATPLAHGRMHATTASAATHATQMPCHGHSSPADPDTPRGGCCDGDGPFQCPMVAVTIVARDVSLAAVVFPDAAPDTPGVVTGVERPATLPLRPPIAA